MALTQPVWREGTPRWVAFSAFTFGAAIGGTLTSTGLVIVGSGLDLISPLVRSGALVVLGGVLVLRDLDMVELPLPQNRRQVPQSVFYRGIAHASARFGFELGTGVRTYVPTSAPYALASAIVLLDLGTGLATLAGLGFGLGRGMTLAMWPRRVGWGQFTPTQWGNALRLLSITYIGTICTIGLGDLLASLPS